MPKDKNRFLSVLTCIALAFISIVSVSNIFVFVGVFLFCSVLIIVLKKRKYDSSELITLFLYVIPIFGFSLFVITSKFNLDPNAEGYLGQQIMLIIATLALPFLGYQCRGIKGFSIKNVLVIIYKLLAFWMLINLVITMFQFGPFYTFIYKGMYFYEYGHLSKVSIDQMAYMFLGIGVERVSVQLFALFGSILSTSLLGLFFVSFEDDKRNFFTYLICGCIGVLTLIYTLNKRSILVYIILVITFTLFILFYKGILKFNKGTKIVIYSFCGVVGVLFLLFVLNALNCRPLANWIKSVWLLNKIFNANDFSKSYKLIIKEFLENKYFSGFTGYLIGKDNVRLSGSWLFDMLMIAQVFGWVCFIAFIVLLFVRYVQYYKTSTDDKMSKVLLLGFTLSIVTVTFVGYNSVPSSVTSKYFPIFFMAPFLLLLVFYGYMGKQEVIKE